MRFSLCATTVLAALITLASASRSQSRVAVQGVAVGRGLQQEQHQQVLKGPDPDPVDLLETLQSITTQTRAWTLYATPTPTGTSPRCNGVLCARCRRWFACREGEARCSYCDATQYCGCEKIASSKGKTCSLGPGRTVPCDGELVAESGVYVFPSPSGRQTASDAEIADGASAHSTCSLAPGRTEPCTAVDDLGLVVFPDRKQELKTTSHRTCSLGPGRTVPCDVVSDAEVFEFGD